MGRNMSDTRTMSWEMYYVYPRSGRRIFLDTLPKLQWPVQSSCNDENLPNHAREQKTFCALAIEYFTDQNSVTFDESCRSRGVWHIVPIFRFFLPVAT